MAPRQATPHLPGLPALRVLSGTSSSLLLPSSAAGSGAAPGFPSSLLSSAGAAARRGGRGAHSSVGRVAAEAAAWRRRHGGGRKADCYSSIALLPGPEEAVAAVRRLTGLCSGSPSSHTWFGAPHLRQWYSFVAAAFRHMFAGWEGQGRSAGSGSGSVSGVIGKRLPPAFRWLGDDTEGGR